MSATLVDGYVTEVGSGRSRTGQLEVFCEGRAGTAMVAGDISDVDSIVANALEQSRYAPVSNVDPLPFPESMAWRTADSGLYHPADMGLKQVMERVRSCQRAVVESAKPEQVVSTRSAFQAMTTVEVVANSLGLIASKSATRYSLECDAAVQKDGEVVHGQWQDAVRDLSLLMAPEALGALVIRRIRAKQGANKLASGVYRAILEPQIATMFAEHLIAAMAGSLVINGATWMAGHRGALVAAPWMDIDEDPLLPGGLNSSSYDSQGYATSPRRLVEAGVLLGYLHDARSATVMGEAMTGHSSGTHNIFVRAPADRLLTPEALLARLGDGIVIAEFFGVGVDLASGTFSLGALGRRVEKGRIVEAVDRFMISGHFSSLFQGAEAMGNDIEQRGNIRIGSLLVTGLVVSGE